MYMPAFAFQISLLLDVFYITFINNLSQRIEVKLLTFVMSCLLLCLFSDTLLLKRFLTGNSGRGLCDFLITSKKMVG